MQKKVYYINVSLKKWKHFKAVTYNITELKRQKTAILKKMKKNKKNS